MKRSAAKVVEVVVTDGRVPVRLGPRSARVWVVLAHGAGGSVDDPLTCGLAARLRLAGVGVAETTFLYKAAGRRMPDRMQVLERTYTEVVTDLHRRVKPERLLAGGKSMGGRVAARIAHDVTSVDGLVLLSYPLRPPSQVTATNLQDRRDTLARLDVPTLVAQGTRDPFGGPEAIAELAPSARVLGIDGADHDLATKGGRVADATLDALSRAVLAFLDDVPLRRAKT